MKPEELARIKSILQWSWSQDGKSLLYITNLGGDFDIWEIPREKGYPQQVTFLERKVSNLSIPRDGEWMVFTCDPEAKEIHEIYLLPIKGGEPVKEDILINFIPVLDFSPEGRFLLYINRDETGYENLYLYDIVRKKRRKLTDEHGEKMEAVFSKDGRFIAYVHFHDVMRSDIILLERESGHKINLTREIGGENKEPDFSYDSRYLAFCSDFQGVNNVVIVDLQRRRVLRCLPEVRYERRRPRWSPLGKLAYVMIEEGNALLHVMSSPFGDPEPVKLEKGAVLDFKWSPVEDRIAFKYSRATRPAEIYVVEKGEPKRLTNSLIKGLSEEDFVEGEHLYYRSFDGLEIPAFYYKPKGQGPFPALVWIHGGPTSVHLNSFDPLVQLSVSRGIAVLCPNFRGSSGYGKDFESINFRDWGGGDLMDVVCGARFLRGLSMIDPSRIAVGGGSYGGYLALLAVSKFPQEWKAGIDWMGPVNLVTLFMNTSPWLRSFLQKKYGFKPPEEEPEFYRSRSPINFVDKIEAPLQLIYGVNDPRVPCSELKQLEDSLRARGKVYEREVIEEGHSLWNLKSRVRVYNMMVSFLEKHLLQGG